MISRFHDKKDGSKKLTKTCSSKSQAFGPQISHNTINGKRILGSKNQT